MKRFPSWESETKFNRVVNLQCGRIRNTNHKVSNATKNLNVPKEISRMDENAEEVEDMYAINDEEIQETIYDEPQPSTSVYHQLQVRNNESDKGSSLINPLKYQFYSDFDFVS